METGLSGKTVIVTSATANIGRSIALAFTGEGANVLGVGRDQEADGRLERLAVGTGEIRFLSDDMLAPDAPAKIHAAARKLGSVKVLINNVGGNVGAGFFVDSHPTS